MSTIDRRNDPSLNAMDAMARSTSCVANNCCAASGVDTFCFDPSAARPSGKSGDTGTSRPEISSTGRELTRLRLSFLDLLERDFAFLAKAGLRHIEHQAAHPDAVADMNIY